MATQLQLKRAFVVLQEKYVSARAIECCPTMDLIAVLTPDHHLIVHRTTSWQKLLHVKPSEVSFEMVALAWRPDGLQLAVGCDEGDVALFEIESGEMVPERRSLRGLRESSFRHENAITAMHWMHVDEAEISKSSGKRRRRQTWASSPPPPAQVSTTSQSKHQFARRSQRFLASHDSQAASATPGFSRETEGRGTVLATADAQGYVALWWAGKVLLALIDVRTHLSEEETRLLENPKQQQGDDGVDFRIERVHVAPDMSTLIVLLNLFGKDGDDVDGGATGINKEERTTLHRVLMLDLSSIQRLHEDIAVVAESADNVHTLLDTLALTSRQLTTEWKNAMRIFELKMGLIGSLYEKYACEDPPQVDMLSVVASGITPPALAQYFAQDIQEMSVHRMQKAMMSGCETLGSLVESKMKRSLVELLFHLSELRGRAKWNSSAYASTLGITVNLLDELVESVQQALIGMETFTQALHETRQDFALFFQWIMERIRVHTNSARSNEAGGVTGGRPTSREANAAAQGAKSLLNQRRLCDFLQRAVASAQHFRDQQPPHNKYRVETSFGNPVSRLLSTKTNIAQIDDKSSNPSVGCLILLERIETQWFTMLKGMAAALVTKVSREENGCFSIGGSGDDAVLEHHIHFRRSFDTGGTDTDQGVEEDGNDSDGEDDGVAVDWSSLKHFGLAHDSRDSCGLMVMGFRLQSGALILMRAAQPHRSGTHFAWDAVVVGFSQGPAGNTIVLESFDFYGDASSGKAEKLALILRRTVDKQVQQEWLYLQPYDHVEFTPTTMSQELTAGPFATSFKTLTARGCSHTFRVDRSRGRTVGSSQAAAFSAPTAAVIATASRGILCVVSPPSRLSVFDAEESEEEDADDQDMEGNAAD